MKNAKSSLGKFHIAVSLSSSYVVRNPAKTKLNTMIYLLRHGETVWNRAGRFQGQGDAPLTAEGVAQARAMGRRLAQEEPAGARLISSPLYRAWQSAVLVAEALSLDPHTIEFEPRLMELGFGDWEGLTREEVKARALDDWRARKADVWNHVPPGGESLAELEARAEDWLTAHRDGETLIVLSHGLTSRVLRGLYLGIRGPDVLRYSVRQTELYRLSGGQVETLSTELAELNELA